MMKIASQQSSHTMIPTGASGGVSYGHLLSPSPIERILIAHLNLHETCMNGKSLDEDASEEEIGEEILFYHRERRISLAEDEDDEEWNLTTGHAHDKASLARESVDFLSLCKALYTLPTELALSTHTHKTENTNNNDRTQSIYFGESIITFVPLESRADIVAILQVSRLHQTSTKSDTGSANPLAITASIQKTHRLFSMLRGGGIRYRLRSMNTTIEKDDAPICSKMEYEQPCVYWGMKTLFLLLRDIRKKTRHLSKMACSGESNRSVLETTQREIAALKDEVQLLRKTLPIQSLRRDLESHYKEYLGQFLEVCIRNGGAGRCLVETMPTPIAQENGSHTFQSLSYCIEDESLENLRQSIVSILESLSLVSPDQNDSSLIGIAAFKSSQLLISLSDNERVDLCNETVNLLMAYMASYRAKMSNAIPFNPNRHLASSPSLPREQPSLLKRLSSHLSPLVDKPHMQISPTRMKTPVKEHSQASETVSYAHDLDQGRGRFLPSPPSYMLDASEATCGVEYGDGNEIVWAPRIHLPHGTMPANHQEATSHHEEVVASHLVVFEIQGFSFLSFVDHRSPKNTRQTHNRNLIGLEKILVKLEDAFSGVVHRLSQRNPSAFICGKSSPCIEPIPGENVIILERSKQRMVLLLDPKAPVSRRGSMQKCTIRTTGTSTPPPTRRFLGFGPKGSDSLPDTKQRQLPSYHRSTPLEWSSWGLDCRHLLASRLPLDVCLAFDDVIHEVIQRQNSGTEDNHHSFPFEVCTSVPHGWIYAFATQQKEIYAFFESSVYVTIADVQAAALRMKEKFSVS